MLTEIDQRELLEFSATEPVLSLYLNTDPSTGNADAYRLRLRNMLKEINLPQDAEAVERYFATQYNWSGRGVVVFSCAPRGFFRAFPLALPVRDMITTGGRPSVKILADLLDNYGGYGVVLVDKQGARVFSFHLGQLVEQEGVLGETIRHTKNGGASSRLGQRGASTGQTHAQDELVARNMKDAVEFAVRFFEEKHIRRILIGGTEDNVAMFRSLLPKSWQSLVMGTFPMSMSASQAEVLARSMEKSMDAEHEQEKHMVERLITRAAKDDAAVIGMANTLEKVNESRVQTLFFQEDYHAPAFQCQECGRLISQKGIKCAVCGGSLQHVPDVVELAVSAVLRAGGDVEVVHDGAGLAEAGNIGALLRY